MNVCVRALCRPAVTAVEERRVGRDRQQDRQHRTEPVADRDGAVGAADTDVDVHRERVVAPRHVLEPFLNPPVVVGLDDLLGAVVRERMGAGGAELHVVAGGEREQPAAQLTLGVLGGSQILAAAGPDLDLRRDQLAGDRLARAPRSSAAAASRSRSKLPGQLQRLRIEDRELLLDADRQIGRCSRGPRTRRRDRSPCTCGIDGEASWGGEWVVSPSIRSDRSTARRADRPQGWRCGR